MELKAGNKGREYKIEAIFDCMVYARKSKSGHSLELYYLISWKGYLKEKNTYKLALTIQYPRKLISSFYKNHTDKLTAIFEAINTILLMAKQIIKIATRKLK